MSKALVIIKSMGIGDLCILISNVHAISKKMGCPVTVMAQKNTRANAILKHDPHVEEVIELNEKGFFNIVKKIKSKKFDQSYIYSDSIRLYLIASGIPGYRARIRPIVSRITIHWPSFYNVVTGKTLALPNLIALQHIPLSPAGVIAKRPAPIALPNSCAAEWRMAPDAVFSPYASVRYFTPHMVHSQYNLL